MTQAVSHVLRFLVFFTVKCSPLAVQSVATSSSILQLIKALVTFACFGVEVERVAWSGRRQTKGCIFGLFFNSFSLGTLNLGFPSFDQLTLGYSYRFWIYECLINFKYKIVQGQMALKISFGHNYKPCAFWMAKKNNKIVLQLQFKFLSFFNSFSGELWMNDALKSALAFDSLWSLLMSHFLIDTTRGLYGTLLHLFYKCTFHRKPVINFPKTYRHTFPKRKK